MPDNQLLYSPAAKEAEEVAPEPNNPLECLNERASLAQKVESIHVALRTHVPVVDRVAADVHDRKTDLLEAVVESSPGEDARVNYQTRLEAAPAVRAMLQNSHPRAMVQKLGRFRRSEDCDASHYHQIGYASHCTMPMYDNGEFFGFLYFSSHSPDAFDLKSLHTLDVFGHLISLLIITEINKGRMLVGTIEAARAFTVQRDAETGAHVNRMAHYVRLIAADLAPAYGLPDDYVEKLFLFAPLHDVGKIAIPDSILLKPGKLTPEEFEVMKTHTLRGRQLVDELIADFRLGGIEGINILRNIATFHHESLNGTGYPLGLKAEEIPLEARIIAVADVFDALTSKRPYKERLSNEESFTILEGMAGSKLDPQCVRALANHRQDIEEIQRMFAEDSFG